jgi:DNA helicase II / ATP-dependent DNA helicase PcrA
MEFRGSSILKERQELSKMADRKFDLPGIHELSKEQEQAIRLPMAGCHLIVGGPGTGKTVVTLLRLRRFVHQQKDSQCLFLVYNHLLHETAKQLFGEKMISSTWHRWFMQIYFRHMKEPVPLLEKDSDFNPIDWETVINNVAGMDFTDPPEKSYLFIDEGQDMPPHFYTALIRMGFENFYVVCDQNQAITAENCSRKQLEESLAIDPDAVIELKHNYRNSIGVARLARDFHPGDPATPHLDLPLESASGQAPFLIEYGPGCRLDFGKVIERLLKMADRDPKKLIGIITPTNEVRNKYVQALCQTMQSDSIDLDNGRPRIATYAYGKRTELKFDEGGICVINAQSCKGLEFDTVFIADINAFHCYPAIVDERKRLFYVMIARAIEQVFMLKEAGDTCSIDCILPENSTFLKYWR